MNLRPTALVVGASRGLGLALAEEWASRGWHVIATVRGEAPGLEALRRRYPSAQKVEHTDIIKADDVRALGKRLIGRPVDVLFVNAGISKSNEKTPADDVDGDFVDMMLTNALGPMRVVEVLQHLVPPGGVIAVMSSELGSIANNNGFWELYSSSKAALNMLMKCFAARHSGDDRALLLVAPGWIRTEMGGAGAPLSIADSIPNVVNAVDESRGTRGLRYIDRHGKSLPW